MGISNFNGWYMRKMSGLRKGTSYSREPKNVSYVLVDLNSVLHKVAQKCFGYGDYENLEVMLKANGNILAAREQYLRDIKTELSRIYERFVPTKLMSIYIDGAIPSAKMMQQRQRRYKKETSKPGAPKSQFSPVELTPGTDTMVSVDGAIREWLVDAALIYPTDIIYSSHLVPGEGEEKLFSHIRTLNANKALSSEDTIIVYGNDSDLVMLSLIHVRNNGPRYFVFREQSMEPYESFYNINELKTNIEGKGIATEDFIVGWFLRGNDFVPTPPSFEDIEVMYHSVFSSIAALNRRDVATFRIVGDIDPIVSTGEADTERMINVGLSGPKINMTRFMKMLEPLADREAQMLDHNISNEYMRRATNCPLYQNSIIKEDDEYVLDYTSFRRNWYLYEFSPKGDSIPEDLLRRFVPLEYREGDTPEQADKRKNDYERWFEGHVKLMCYFFVQVIQWNLLYYYQGKSAVNNFSYYPYHRAPLLIDIYNYLDRYRNDATLRSQLPDNYLPSEPRNDPPTVIEQLAAVMPLSSSNVVPFALRETIFKEDSPLGHNFVDTFLIDSEGKSQEYRDVAILPFPDLLEIRDIVNSYQYLSSLSKKFAPQTPVLQQTKLSEARIHEYMVAKVKRLDEGISWPEVRSEGRQSVSIARMLVPESYTGPTTVGQVKMRQRKDQDEGSKLIVARLEARDKLPPVGSIGMLIHQRTGGWDKLKEGDQLRLQIVNQGGEAYITILAIRRYSNSKQKGTVVRKAIEKLREELTPEEINMLYGGDMELMIADIGEKEPDVTGRRREGMKEHIIASAGWVLVTYRVDEGMRSDVKMVEMKHSKHIQERKEQSQRERLIVPLVPIMPSVTSGIRRIAIARPT